MAKAVLRDRDNSMLRDGTTLFKTINTVNHTSKTIAAGKTVTITATVSSAKESRFIGYKALAISNIKLWEGDGRKIAIRSYGFDGDDVYVDVVNADSSPAYVTVDFEILCVSNKTED